MIPILAGAGLRAIAPDLVGYGRSDKPSRRPAEVALGDRGHPGSVHDRQLRHQFRRMLRTVPG